MGETHRPKLLKCHRKYWTNVVFFLTNILEESNSELLFLPFSNPIHGSGCARLWPKSLVAEWAACFVPFNKMFSSKPYITYCSAAHVVINLCNPIRMSHNVCKDCAKWDCLVCMVQCGWSKVVGAILFPKPVWMVLTKDLYTKPTREWLVTWYRCDQIKRSQGLIGNCHI